MKTPWIFGKKVLITGATSGIGRNIAEILLNKYNCEIVGVSRNEDKAKKVSEELSTLGKYSYFCFDVSQKEEWKKLKIELDQRGFVPDLIINNAGVLPKFSSADKLSVEDFERVLNIDFLSSVYSFKTFYNEKNGITPSFLNVSSSAALLSLAGTSAYSSAKSALKAFTECVSYELKGKAYVGLVCPGFTRTEIFRSQNQSIDSGLIGKISMCSTKMATKIVRGIVKKKRRMVFGKDAHLMSVLARLFPKKSTDIASFFLKKSGMKLFEDVFGN